MKFSVIIPLYNGAQFIEATLDSVLAQTCKDYEILLVNDGSPDDVGEVVKRYISAHPEIDFKYFEQKNKGLGGARNTAIRHASGKIIAILDQDDKWYPEKLEKVAKVFDEHLEVDVVCHNFYVQKNGKKTVLYTTGPNDKNLHRRMLFGGNRLATLTTCFRKSVFDKVDYFSEDKENMHFVEDYDMWLRMAFAGCRFYFMPGYLAEYIQHEGNYSITAVERMYKSEIHVIDLHYAKLKNKRLLDWHRIRKRKARRAALVSWYFLKHHQRNKARQYCWTALKFDPFFVVSLLPKIPGKIRKFVERRR